MRHSGLFSALRRRRIALSAFFAYLLLLNGMVATLAAGELAATGPGSLLAAAPLCDPQHAPADHRSNCPCCDLFCPMGGCAPVSPSPPVIGALTPPSAAPLAALDGRRGAPLYPRSIHLSDHAAQAPPRSA